MTALEFAIAITDKSVQEKQAALDAIKISLSRNIGPDNTDLTLPQRRSLNQLCKWILVNMMVGTELCPPSTLSVYSTDELQ